MTYPSDLTSSQWDLIKEHFDTGENGKSRKHSKRELVNAVLLYNQDRVSMALFTERISSMENSL